MGWKGVLHEWYGCRMETGRWRGRGGQHASARGTTGNRTTSTPCHRHEQLLMGWLRHASVREQQEMGMGGQEMLPHTLMTTRAHPATAVSSRRHPSQMQGVFLFILFHLKLVVTAPLPVRRGVLLILRTLNRNVLGLNWDSWEHIGMSGIHRESTGNIGIQ